MLGPLLFGWAPEFETLGAQLATEKKMLVSIPVGSVKELSCKFYEVISIIHGNMIF